MISFLSIWIDSKEKKDYKRSKLRVKDLFNNPFYSGIWGKCSGATSEKCANKLE